MTTTTNHLHGAHLRRKESLRTIELLHVLHGALVRLWHIRTVRLKIERRWPRARHAHRLRDCRIQLTRLRRSDQIRPRQLFLEIAVDLASDRARGRRTAFRKLPNILLAKTRI